LQILLFSYPLENNIPTGCRAYIPTGLPHAYYIYAFSSSHVAVIYAFMLHVAGRRDVRMAPSFASLASFVIYGILVCLVCHICLFLALLRTIKDVRLSQYMLSSSTQPTPHVHLTSTSRPPQARNVTTDWSLLFSMHTGDGVMLTSLLLTSLLLRSETEGPLASPTKQQPSSGHSLQVIYKYTNYIHICNVCI
jgi:hypothetical protein